MRLLCLALAAATLNAQIKPGHSRHGEGFDSGPRSKPWDMPGIGSTHFRITHKNPEVQKWFDQGNTLLHSFWDYEAERSFRWCLKLEPENAMAWWGLARAVGEERAAPFVREAVRRKHLVTERERLYIEALEAQHSPKALRDRNSYSGGKDDSRHKKILETLCVKYPEDMEARALLALYTLGEARYGAEQVIREILAKQPSHPGGHHYRIHNWNGHEPEQALDSCKRYGEIAPAAGHALHMPGHIYSTVGMWHEAAISMDSATRAEKQYMRERMIFPFNAWNYGHNRNYLNYILEQLGMADAAVFGARQMLDAPLDPKYNANPNYSTHSQGIVSMVRTLVKFERWKELLDPKTIPWRDIFNDRMYRHYAEARAHLGLKDVFKAEQSITSFADLEKELEKNKGMEKTYRVMRVDLDARLDLARGETLRGLALLGEAAGKQADLQRDMNDPPFYPEVAYVLLGREYLAQKSPALAVRAFGKALDVTRNDWFALAGLVEAHAALGDRTQAANAMARLLHATSGADKGLAAIERARATGITAQPHDDSPRPQRDFSSMQLDRFGPAVWEPHGAGARRGRSRRQEGDAQRLPREERHPDLLSRQRVPALPEAAPRHQREAERVGAAGHRGPRGVVEQARSQCRGIENDQRALRPDPFRHGIRQRPPLPVLR